jgi:hypothetical protein
MQSHRVLVASVELDGRPVPTNYADVFVVVRDGEAGPGPSDWEVNLQTEDRWPIPPGRYELAMAIPDGATYRGDAYVRFTDGTRHLLRGDSDLVGFT